MAKSTRPKARDPKKADDFMAGQAVKRGNNAARRRAKEAAMDEKAKKPMKKMCGGKMKAKKMASGGSCRGMGAAKKGGKYSRAG